MQCLRSGIGPCDVSRTTLVGSITLRRMPPFRRISSWPGSSVRALGERLRDGGCQGRGCLGFRTIGTRGVRRDATRQRAAEKVARRLGMQWVGETNKYYDLRLQVYRLRPTDLAPVSDPSRRSAAHTGARALPAPSRSQSTWGRGVGRGACSVAAAARTSMRSPGRPKMLSTSAGPSRCCRTSAAPGCRTGCLTTASTTSRSPRMSRIRPLTRTATEPVVRARFRSRLRHGDDDLPRRTPPAGSAGARCARSPGVA
jgi:hypothetical protein